MYGSPHAMQIWDDFFAFMVQKGFSSKVALEGVSRGGLYVYNWAKRNPLNVSCIYAEAPVCDFKSWPGGKGVGKGSPESWTGLLKSYGFTEEQAMAYKNNPIDNLEGLAACRVPVLHAIGLNDQIVPNAENTYLLVNNYIRLGGIATVYPMTRGEQKLEGHHFSIERPEQIADFIFENSYPVKKMLDPAAYHTPRSNLNNSFLKFTRDKKGRVAFMGGSITEHGAWRNKVCNYLKEKFPGTSFEFINAGISSTGSTPGAFRLEKEVLSAGPIDLFFEEAAVNDRTNGFDNNSQIRGMEGIVRHALLSNPYMDIVLMHFVDPAKMEDYNKGISGAL
jgi:sialidase-1